MGNALLWIFIDRTTRFVAQLHLPNGRSTKEVEAAIGKEIKTLPKSLMKRITWDQGSELTRNSEFTVATGIYVYFFDPPSSWQRGSNEKANSLIRYYLPKSTDLAKYSRTDRKRIQGSLNERPRMTLGFVKTSGETSRARFAAVTA